MGIGTSIFLIAVGAILAYAVNADISGFEIDTAGQILLIIGIIGLIISLLYEFMYSRPRKTAAVTRYDESPPVVREREVPVRERDRFRDR